MKKREYTTNEGTTKATYKLEVNDEFISGWDNPNKKVFSNPKGDITKYSIKAICEGEELYIELTKGQYTRLKNMSEDDSLLGKVLVATSYKNSFGDQIGISLK